MNVNTVENKLSTPSSDVNDVNHVPSSNEVPKDPKYTSLKPYALHLSFPQRMAKANYSIYRCFVSNALLC